METKLPVRRAYGPAQTLQQSPAICALCTLALVALLGSIAACVQVQRAPESVVAHAADGLPPVATWPSKVYYRYAEVHGRRIFYRESGDPSWPHVLLLHGFPSSSHTYRELIPLLSGRFHVIAPDYLGSGFSDHPKPNEVPYTFNLLAEYVTGLVDALGIDRYVLYMQDFGSPVGFRVAIAHPERVRGLVIQNANAYLDGLTPARQKFFREANTDRSPEKIVTLLDYVGRDAVINRQYLRDVPGEKRALMSPDAWTHDLIGLATEKDRMIQVRLFQDYASNLDAYPMWQDFLRRQQPATLIVWGRNDPAFIPAGAQAYLRDIPDAELHLLDAGHFALEERPVEIAQLMVRFIERLGH